VGLELDRRAHHQGGGEGGLAVVDVPDGADVDVRFRPREYFLCHRSSARFKALHPRPVSPGKGGRYVLPELESCCWDLNPETSSLPMKCSTIELQQRVSLMTLHGEAGDGTRTHNRKIGNLGL